MANVWSGHFDSTEDNERLLLAEDWAKYIRAFISDGIRNGGNCLQVTEGNGMSVNLATGIANIQGYILYVDEDNNGKYYNVSVPDANPSLPRIDRLILRLDRTIEIREIIPMVKIGNAAQNPVPPDLTRDMRHWELSLAQIRVNAGAIHIINDNITDERFKENVCGIMHSILGLESDVWQAAFDSFMAKIDYDFEGSQTDRATTFIEQKDRQQSEWQSQTDLQQDQFGTMMSGMQNDLATAAGFDFWNAARMPGNDYVTEYPPDGTIVTTIRRATDNVRIAVGTTSYPDDGSVAYEEVVFQPDGVEIQRHTQETTTYPDDGTIRRKVEILL